MCGTLYVQALYQFLPAFYVEMSSGLDTYIQRVSAKGRPLTSFAQGSTIRVSNTMEKGYSYTLQEAPGTKFAEGFTPAYTPGEMLALGVFGGKYLNDCYTEFPAEWFLRAALLGKLCPGSQAEDISINYFKADSRLPLSKWKENGWLPSSKKAIASATTHRNAVLSDPTKNPDGRGWFQWYCRYWMGRRIPELDAVQVQRWKSFARHYGAVKKRCVRGDETCRPRQRQALLQWSWPQP
jgi:hypothetical protein